MQAYACAHIYPNESEESSAWKPKYHYSISDFLGLYKSFVEAGFPQLEALPAANPQPISRQIIYFFIRDKKLTAVVDDAHLQSQGTHNTHEYAIHAKVKYIFL